MVVKAAFTCNVGRKRSNNQDNVFFAGTALPLVHLNDKSTFSKKYCTSEGVCFAVFDGAGGTQFGERASFLATKRMQKTSYVLSDEQTEREILRSFCFKANEDVLAEKKNSSLNSIASTAAIVYLKGNAAFCCNLGDSKILLYRDGGLSQISYDHVAKSSSNGKKPPITQFLGLDIEVGFLEPYIAEIEVMKDDVIIICSDGLTDMVSLSDITYGIEHRKSPSGLNRTLLKKALKNGGRDNISIVSVRVKK